SEAPCMTLKFSPRRAQTRPDGVKALFCGLGGFFHSHALKLHQYESHALTLVHRHQDLTRCLRRFFAPSGHLRAHGVAIELVGIDDVALALCVDRFALHRTALIADDVGNDLVDPRAHLRPFFKLRETPMHDDEHFLTHVIDVFEGHTLSTRQTPDERKMRLIDFFEVQDIARTLGGSAGSARTMLDRTVLGRTALA